MPSYPLTIIDKEKEAMEYATFVRKPFTVKAVRVTRENMGEVAKLVGDLREDEETGGPYILVDRRLVPNVLKVYPGFFMTRMGKQVRCYSPKSFAAQFMELDDNIQQWLDYLEKAGESESVA